MSRKERKWATKERIATQEFQSAEADKERNFQVDMFNRENEYNSAVNQRARLEEAGLNPYLMMDGGDAGTAGSVSGVNPPSGANPSVPQSEIGNVISGIDTLQDSVNSFYDNMMKSATTQGIQYENAFKDPNTFGRDTWSANTLKTLGDNLGFLSGEAVDRIVGKDGHSRWAKAYKAEALDNSLKGMELDNQNKELHNQMVQANLIQVNLTSEAQRTINKYLDQSEYTKLNIASAAYTEMAARGQLTYEKWRGQIIDNLKGTLDYKIASKVADDFIRASCSAYRMQNAMNNYQFADILDSDGKPTGKKYYQDSMTQDLNNKRLHGKSLDRNYNWLDFTSGAGQLMSGFGSAAGGLSNILKIEKQIPAPKKIGTTTKKYNSDNEYTGSIIQTYDYD